MGQLIAHVAVLAPFTVGAFIRQRIKQELTDVFGKSQKPGLVWGHF